MTLKEYLEQGVKKAELARRFKVCRRTIYNWIYAGDVDRDLDVYAAGRSQPAAQPQRIAPFKATIDTRLKKFPALTAQRLFQDVQAEGYEGSYSSVRDYVRQVRPQAERTDRLVRFETKAGQQGQVDFGSFNLPWGRRYALVVVLSFSRVLWVRFYTNQTMEVLFHGLESAFERFGGVPRELLFDQMRTVVVSDGRQWGGTVTFNTEFLLFANHWNFRPRACRPYRPQTKGKVERSIRYVRENFFYGQSFITDEDLNEQAERWLDVTANVRRHSTTGERPVDRFEGVERKALRPLAPAPFRHNGAPPSPVIWPPSALSVEVEKRSLHVYGEAMP